MNIMKKLYIDMFLGNTPSSAPIYYRKDVFI